MVVHSDAAIIELFTERLRIPEMLLIRSPVLRMFLYYNFSQLTFPSSVNRLSRNFSTRRGCTQKEALLCLFPESAPEKMWGETSPIFTEFRTYRNILSAVIV